MAGKQSEATNGSTPLPDGRALAFGQFVLDRRAKQLLEKGEHIRLGGRAFDLLTVLVERAGEVVSKADLIKYVWPTTVVEEINLRVHIAALRRALGEGQHGIRYIASVAGRGYTFVAHVEVAPGTPLQRNPRPTPDVARSNNLPAGLTRLLGREEQKARVEELLKSRRFVSIVGPGGIGKTAFSLAVGSALADTFEHGVWFIELANIRETERVPSAIAAGLDFSIPEDDEERALATFIQSKSMLVILDNCEHLVESISNHAVRLLKAAPKLHLLITSREQIQAEGEWVFRLPALELPARRPNISVAEGLASPAVQLFVERAIASHDTFELSSSNVAQVAELCRKLDGLPLAIELAAARVDAYGVFGTLRLIEDHSKINAMNTRALLPRHRAMNALLDWSFDLLSPSEQTLFRRLSIFRGDFPVNWALEIAPFDDTTVVEGIGSLVAKSLLMTQASEDEILYRMLQTTRVYAYEKLQGDAEAKSVSRAHAEMLRDFFDGKEPTWDAMNRVEWLSKYGRTMDDVRLALDWAFGDDGDPLLGIQLTLATVVLGCQLSLIDETRKRLAQALHALSLLTAPQPQLELRIRMAGSMTMTQTVGPSQDMHSEMQAALQISNSLNSDDAIGNAEQRADVANAMWGTSFVGGDYPASLRWAEELAEIGRSAGNTFYEIIALRVSSQSNHYLGNHDIALRYSEKVLDAQTSKIRLGLHSTTPVDRRVSMRINKARILWMTGFADQACVIAEEAVALSRTDIAPSFIQAALTATVSIFLWRGEDHRAQPLVSEVMEHAARHNLALWQNWASNFDALLRWRALPASTRPPFRIVIEDSKQLDLFCTFEPSMIGSNTIERVDNGTVGWCAPEVLRGVAENLAARGNAPFDQLLEILDRARNIARKQNALAWELRIATSQARLWIARGVHDLAKSSLTPVLDRITEGFETQDVVVARTVLEQANA